MKIGLKNFSDIGIPLDKSQTKVFQTPLIVSQMHLQGCRTIRSRHRTKHNVNFSEGRIKYRDKYKFMRKLSDCVLHY